MHRVLMGNPVGLRIDHSNHDTLDNRKSNLISCTNAENCSNRKGANRNSKSGVRGVCHLKSGKWSAYIKVNRIQKNLGTFDSLDDARGARQIASDKYFGKFGGGL